MGILSFGLVESIPRLLLDFIQGHFWLTTLALIIGIPLTIPTPLSTNYPEQGARVTYCEVNLDVDRLSFEQE